MNESTPPAKGPKKRPSQADIARLANVSQATVSLVLNGRTDELKIAARTQRRVLDAIEELGYVANPIARSLASGRTQLLGVHTFEPVFPIQHYDFYHPFLVGIEEECAVRNYNLVLFTNVPNGEGRRSVYSGGVNRLRLADGAILLGRDPDPEELARLAEEEFPFVFIGRRDAAGADVPYVTADYVSGVGEVVDNFVRLGHRRICYVGASVVREPERERETGYHAALARHGLDLDQDLQWRLNADEISVAWLDSILRRDVTAFFVEEASTARRMLRALADLGRQVPGHCSIATLTDLDDAAPGTNWGGLHIPRQEMGRAAVSLLIDLLAGDASHRQVVLPCTFIQRGTVAAASRP